MREDVPRRYRRHRDREEAATVAVHITIEDHDDRPERMVRDPDRYFADARRRAEQEIMHQARWLFPAQRHPKRR
jgi:hypothetical protein